MKAAETVDARKTAIKPKEALELARDADELFATKGKNVVRLDLKAGAADPGELSALMIGPFGNLRAPTLRVGRTLVVGFDEATYAKVLKKV